MPRSLSVSWLILVVNLKRFRTTQKEASGCVWECISKEAYVRRKALLCKRQGPFHGLELQLNQIGKMSDVKLCFWTINTMKLGTLSSGGLYPYTLSEQKHTLPP